MYGLGAAARAVMERAGVGTLGLVYPPQEIVTPRLRLRLPRSSDAEAVFAYASDPEVTRHLSFVTHAHVDASRDFLTRGAAAWEQGSGHRPWIIEDRGSGAVIGAIGMDVDGCRANVGYALRASAWGAGRMTEALAAVRDVAFAHPDVWRFHAWHSVHNPASGRVMAKVGMRMEGVLRCWAVMPNHGPEPVDACMWSMLREEWAALGTG